MTRTYFPNVDYSAVAHHEAAHAVVATATGAGRVRLIELAPGFGCHGVAQIESVSAAFEPYLTGDPAGTAYLRARLTDVLAGPVADGLTGDGPTSFTEWKTRECEEWGFEDDDEVDPESDLGDVVRLSRLLGVDPADVWAEAERILRDPAVWESVEAVAAELLRRKAAGLDPVLDADEYFEVLDDAPWLWTYEVTSLGEALVVSSAARRPA